jgi:hypothetical protein
MLTFVNRIIARYNGDIPSCLSDEICFNLDGALAQISPTLEIAYVLFTSYVTQGYEGLFIAQSLQFEFNFGIGHLPPVARILEQLFYFDLSTYSERLVDAGWDTSWRWLSVYPVLANDFHWFFVPVYFFILGRAYAIARSAWQQKQSPAALAMIMLVTIFIVYSSANMQLAINLDWTVATIMLIYLPSITARTLKRAPKMARYE